MNRFRIVRGLAMCTLSVVMAVGSVTVPLPASAIEETTARPGWNLYEKDPCSTVSYPYDTLLKFNIKNPNTPGPRWDSTDCDWWVKGQEVNLTGVELDYHSYPGKNIVVEPVTQRPNSARGFSEVTFRTPNFDFTDDAARALIGLSMGDHRVWLRLRGDGTSSFIAQALTPGNDVTYAQARSRDRRGNSYVLPSNTEVHFACHWIYDQIEWCSLNIDFQSGTPSFRATAPPELAQGRAFRLNGFALVGDSGTMNLRILQHQGNFLEPS